MLLEFKGKEKKKGKAKEKLEIFGQSAGAPTTFQNAQDPLLLPHRHMFDRGLLGLVRLRMFVVFLFFVFSLLFAGFPCLVFGIFIESLGYSY